MYQFPDAQQTSTVKISALFLTFQTKEHVLRVNKSEITGENAFNGDLFEIGDNYESSKGKKTWFQVFLHILRKQGEIFGLLMYQFAAMQQTSTVKISTFFILRFQTKECILRVNKSEITGENTFNGDLFDIDDNHESNKDEKTWF